jgi:NAD(P)-dependent dehydrogenase (short-subunit alcohol dehydrogenase family)
MLKKLSSEGTVMKFKNKTVMVTGAGKNIGKEIALKFAAEGANIVVLKIHPSVAILHNTLFSNMNATSNMCSVGADLKALKRINLEATRKAYVKSTDKDFAELQAEVLVKTHLPLKYILNINEFI